MSSLPRRRAPQPSARRVGRALLAILPALAVVGCAATGAKASVSGHALNVHAPLPAADAPAVTVDTLVPPTRLSGAAVTVDAIDNDFTPKHAVVKAGTKVTFANTGHNVHDIVPDDPTLLDFGVESAAFGLGSKATFTFDRPGTYAYYCSLHASATAGSMRGVITVEP